MAYLSVDCNYGFSSSKQDILRWLVGIAGSECAASSVDYGGRRVVPAWRVPAQSSSQSSVMSRAEQGGLPRHPKSIGCAPLSVLYGHASTVLPVSFYLVSFAGSFIACIFSGQCEQGQLLWAPLLFHGCNSGLFFVKHQYQWVLSVKSASPRLSAFALSYLVCDGFGRALPTHVMRSPWVCISDSSVLMGACRIL